MEFSMKYHQSMLFKFMEIVWIIKKAGKKKLKWLTRQRFLLKNSKHQVLGCFEGWFVKNKLDIQEINSNKVWVWKEKGSLFNKYNTRKELSLYPAVWLIHFQESRPENLIHSFRIMNVFQETQKMNFSYAHPALWMHDFFTISILRSLCLVHL